jgi:glycosyltransferase involved in cell wall biosynthesis
MGKTIAFLGEKQLMISVIIPVYNPNEILKRSLSNLFDPALNSIPKEIILIDDHSKQDLSYLTQRFPDIHLIRNPENIGPAASRNVGIRASSGDIILFIDADVIISPSIFVKVNEFFYDPANFALVGNVNINSNKEKFTADFFKLQVHFNFNQCSEKFFTGFNTEFGAIRRSILDSVGFFNEKYKKADVEDFEFGTRLNAKVQISLDNSIEIDHFIDLPTGILLKKSLRRSFFWMEILLRKKSFENAHVTNKRAFNAVFAFTGALFLLISLFSFLFRKFYSDIGSIYSIIFFLIGILSIICFLLNDLPFLRFLIEKRGFIFVFRAFFLDFLNSAIIGLGSSLGIIYYLCRKLNR